LNHIPRESVVSQLQAWKPAQKKEIEFYLLLPDGETGISAERRGHQNFPNQMIRIVTQEGVRENQKGLATPPAPAWLV
jgi:hypothetical protein